MTAEPDALRLVPVKPTAAMIEAFYHAEGPVGPDRIVSWSVATAMARGNVIRHLDDIFANAYRAMLAAAPAGQPAAGRETLSKIIRQRLLGVAPDDQEVVLDDDDWRLILAALAHPPAQGSESGGEVERVIALMREKGVEFRDGELCWPFDGVRDGFPLNAQERADLQAALSQPGPASEGDGE